jgi:hypothetical protein
VSEIQEAFDDLVTIIRELGAALIPACAAQYQAPPGFHASSSDGPSNPTLDITIDDRRLAVSSEIGATAASLRLARLQLSPHVTNLHRAVARWEGQEGVSE